MEGASKNIQGLLRVLCDNRFVDRPRASLPCPGHRSAAHGERARAARRPRSEENGNRIAESRDWTERNKRSGSTFIEHILGIADFMASLEVACRERMDVALLTKEE